MSTQLYLETTILSRQTEDAGQRLIAAPFWWSLSSVMLAMGCFSLYILSDGALSKEHYWQWQAGLFVSLNQWLQSCLPDVVWANLTALGDALILLPLLALLSMNHRHVWLSLLATVPFAGGSSIVLKEIASIPRPAAVLDQQNWDVIGTVLSGYNSFPSGHSLCAFAAFSVFLMTRTSTVNWAVITLGLLVASAIAVSRVAVGAHWPIDTLFGAAIGILCAFAGVKVAGILRRKIHSETRKRRVSLLLFGAFIYQLTKQIITTEQADFVVWAALFAALLCALHLLFAETFSIRITIFKHRAI